MWETKNNGQENVKNRTKQAAITKNYASDRNNHTKKYRKPAKYPETTINELNNLFSKDVGISEDSLDKITSVWENTLTYNKEDAENLDNPDSSYMVKLGDIAANRGSKTGRIV